MYSRAQRAHAGFLHVQSNWRVHAILLCTHCSASSLSLTVCSLRTTIKINCQLGQQRISRSRVNRVVSTNQTENQCTYDMYIVHTQKYHIQPTRHE